jgi:hypothetical protein
MTAKCANPLCSRPFLYFRSGKIYLIELPACNAGTALENSRKEIEYFWLCGACAQNMHVALDRNGAVVVEEIASASAGEARIGAKAASREVIRAVA